MRVFTHLNQLVTLSPALQKDGRRLVPEDLGIIQDGAVAFNEEGIVWVGPSNELPARWESLATNLQGHVLTPEIVDCHTHTVFGGDRSLEYAERLNGTSYEEIARRGGGILFTMAETNRLDANQLFTLAVERIKQIQSYGVGTLEIKSGYGLNYKKEKELSLLIDRLKKHFRPRLKIHNTYLAAHDVPKDFASSSEYLEKIVLPLLEELTPLKIIDAVDIFHEKNYFSTTDCEALFLKCRDLGIPTKIHADELNDNDGARLACRYRSLSADHLLKISDAGIEELSRSSTIATLLPGTAFFLGKPLAPARAMLDRGVKVAIASDFNPGSCHIDNVVMVAALAAPQLRLNLCELWAGITLNAAHALGARTQGAIVPGLDARFSLFRCTDLSQISYSWGKNLAVTLP